MTWQDRANKAVAMTEAMVKNKEPKTFELEWSDICGWQEIIMSVGEIIPCYM